MKVKHVQNKAVEPTLDQLIREFKCGLFGHTFNYPPGTGGYAWNPLTHCYRCGRKDILARDVNEWDIPKGYSPKALKASLNALFVYEEIMKMQKKGILE